MSSEQFPVVPSGSQGWYPGCGGTAAVEVWLVWVGTWLGALSQSLSLSLSLTLSLHTHKMG